MSNKTHLKNLKAQTAIEYLLLLTMTAVLVFVGLIPLLSRVFDASNNFYKKAAVGIMGCGDAPITCVTQGRECGTILDECGGTMSCDYVCQGKGPQYRCVGGACQCIPRDPMSACDAGHTCQTRSDGCGGSVNCAALCTSLGGVCRGATNFCFFSGGGGDIGGDS